MASITSVSRHASSLAPVAARRKSMTWQSVQNIVLSRIEDATWPEGQMIPPETELAAQFGCARATVNRALQDLASKGVLERRRRVGTRVAIHPKVQMVRSLLRRELEAAGRTYSYLFLGCTQDLPPADVAAAMLVRQTEPLIYSRAAFTADGAPYCCEERWTNGYAAPGLDAKVLQDISACEWLLGNVPLNRATVSIGVTRANRDLSAPHLGVEEGEPILQLERMEWLNNMPVSLHRRYFPQSHQIIADL